MKIGFRIPNIQKSISAKLSVNRKLVQDMGFGKGLIPDRKKQRYNRRYRKFVKKFDELAKPVPAFSYLKSDRIVEIQKSLKSKNLYKGKIDGILDIKTVAAIKEFQKKLGMLPTGDLDLRTLSEILKK